MIDYQHKSVLLQKAIEYLNVKEGKKYIDATLGGGGYSFEIAKLGGIVLGIDLDPDAIQFVKDKIKDQKSKLKNLENIILVWGNFGDIDKLAGLHSFDTVSGIVFDLGVSSYQIEKSGRGFSFLKDEPLDMRMNPSASSGQITAAEIINKWKEEDLYELFSKKGEEHYAQALAQRIVFTRKVKPIITSRELSDLIMDTIPRRGRIHPATKVFQALRLEVNNELENLKKAIAASVSLLDTRGRIVVVSFHSLEDRLVKIAFKEFEAKGLGSQIVKKPIRADKAEINRNNRSRSAKMRVFEKN